ncbi:uncharacterized protein LOC119699509 [Motacilla alba alba]|uniref:uncharacterized protein LOC119699509 n=1 Tax=Motacilla alba alba TaxID=1094192 RepID=UPI0018D56A33|nr:uncharacterized protein LOC119699509 [Motacilla alba alba]
MMLTFLRNAFPPSPTEAGGSSTCCGHVPSCVSRWWHFVPFLGLVPSLCGKQTAPTPRRARGSWLQQGPAAGPGRAPGTAAAPQVLLCISGDNVFREGKRVLVCWELQPERNDSVREPPPAAPRATRRGERRRSESCSRDSPQPVGARGWQRPPQSLGSPPWQQRPPCRTWGSPCRAGGCPEGSVTPWEAPREQGPGREPWGEEPVQEQGPGRELWGEEPVQEQGPGRSRDPVGASGWSSPWGTVAMEGTHRGAVCAGTARGKCRLQRAVCLPLWAGRDNHTSPEHTDTALSRDFPGKLREAVRQLRDKNEKQFCCPLAAAAAVPVWNVLWRLLYQRVAC